MTTVKDHESDHVVSLAEQALLGCCLINPKAATETLHLLGSDLKVFLDNRHQRIYEAIIRLVESGAEVDEVTVAEALNNNGQLEHSGGYYYLAELTGAMPLSTSVPHYANIVLSNYRMRTALYAAKMALNVLTGEAGDPDVLLSKVEGIMSKAFERSASSKTKHVSDGLRDALSTIKEMSESGGEYGVKSGIPKIDDTIGGFIPGDLVIIAGRPSMGKTALALLMMRELCLSKNEPALFLSLEMMSQQICERLMVTHKTIDILGLKRGVAHKDELGRAGDAADGLKGMPLYINDRDQATVWDIISEARHAKARYNIKAVFIDYLQIIRIASPSRNRSEDVAIVTRQLKAMAKELEIPVIALSQFTRTSDEHVEGPPRLSYLSESAGIEQAADVVISLSPINKATRDHLEKTTSKWVAEASIRLSVIKNRHGGTGSGPVIFDKGRQTFYSAEQEATPKPTEQPAPPNDASVTDEEMDELLPGIGGKDRS